MSLLNNEHCRAIRPLDLAIALTSPLALDVWLGIDGLPLKKGLGVRPRPGNCLIRVSYLSKIVAFAILACLRSQTPVFRWAFALRKNAAFLGFSRLGRAIPGNEFEIIVVALGASESLFSR